LLPADTTDKVFIGMADANRLDSRFMGSTGNFLNVLPLRFDRPRRQTFGEAVSAARDKAYSALENSALPFDLLLDELAVPRSNMWAPIFQVFIDYRLVPIPPEQRTWAGCRVSEETWYPARSGYDVVLEVTENQKDTSLKVHVQKGIYNNNAAELLLSSYINILTQVSKQGERIDINMLEKWDGADVKKALDIGRGLY
jgi:hybrid polyketide synthase/nonribosomal peptide synthetase ACE1